MEIALYLHIPFCEHKCPYCDFNSYAGLGVLQAPYVEALVAEMTWLVSRGKWSANTIFIGGGTPTVLSLPQLTQVLDAARVHFRVSPKAEVTVEANPGTVGEEYLAGLRAAGVNRLSLGAQSFHDDELCLLGRIHAATEIEMAFHAARRAGFQNVNLDLIYGLPEQSLDRWRTTLGQALSLSPEHLSLYSLTIEDGTLFADWVAQGKLPSPEDDLAADMYELAEEMLEEAGYFHYEVSNWAREATQNLPFVCQHNLVYWRNGAYLGVGAGAHSSWSGRRWHNLLSPQEYVARMAMQTAGGAPWESPVVGEVEVIDESLAMGETMMLGLRLLEEGVPLSRFASRFGRSLLDVYQNEVNTLEEEGLLERLADRVRLTRRGRLLGNQVFACFLPGD